MKEEPTIYGTSWTLDMHSLTYQKFAVNRVAIADSRAGNQSVGSINVAVVVAVVWFVRLKVFHAPFGLGSVVASYDQGVLTTCQPFTCICPPEQDIDRTGNCK